MNLQFFLPSKELQSFIKCYYVSECRYQQIIEDVFFPDGSIEIVIHAGLDFYRDGIKECEAKVLGQITTPLTMQAAGAGRSFGIWFWPHAFSYFSGSPVCEFNDKALPLEFIFSSTFISEVQDHLSNYDNALLINAANLYLAQHLKCKYDIKDKIVLYAASYITANPSAINLDRLIAECNISSRYLQKIFREKIGYGPKFLMRITRFQHALRLLRNEKAFNMTALSYKAGFYDQAHFIRDFKEFTGYAPTEYQPHQSVINQHFIGL